jgi:hypothetical protein
LLLAEEAGLEAVEDEEEECEWCEDELCDEEPGTAQLGGGLSVDGKAGMECALRRPAPLPGWFPLALALASYGG